MEGEYLDVITIDSSPIEGFYKLQLTRPLLQVYTNYNCFFQYLLSTRPLLKVSTNNNCFFQYLPVDSSPIEGFYIYYKPFHSQEADKQIPILGAGIRQHILDRLNPDTEYSIRMQCFNSAGTSDYSTTVVQRTPASGNPKIPSFPDLPTLNPETAADGRTRRPDSKNDYPARTPVSDEGDGGGGGGVRGKSDTRLSSETLYLALGVVLAVLFAVLGVFMVVCWWRQRKQRALLGE